jgi:phosphatidylglycerophosphate synthase
VRRLTRDEYLDGWARLHGTDPRSSAMVRSWLAASYALARPLAAARVAPGALTALGVLLACAAVPAALAGGRWPLLGAVVVAGSGLVDSLDGAVAVLSRRASARGALADALADRVSDVAYCVALWALGAPGWMACVAAGLALLHEYARARAAGAGLRDAGVITVAERPTRVIGAVAFLLAAGAYPSSAAHWGTAGAGFGIVLGAVGLAQLLVVLSRRLS